MLTIHTADLVVTGDRRPSLPGGAVLVDGRRCAAVGPYGELAAAFPGARVRRWPGLLTPGLVNPYGPELLERAYHPDPREAAELGTSPVVGEALAGLAMTDARWGASARRGVQRMLAHGVVAVAGALSRTSAEDAVHRVGMRIEERSGQPPGTPSLDPLAAAMVPPLPFARHHQAYATGLDATFAVFDVPDEDALARRGAGSCVATVLKGRLVHRRR